MDKYGVLVVDDSALMRKTISSIIDHSQDFYVVGKARNGIDAIEKVKRLNPSIVILDVEMPELDGIETLKILMTELPIPVIMLSNYVDPKRKSFELGAADYVLKSDLFKQSKEDQLEQFYQKLNLALMKEFPKQEVSDLKNESQKEEKTDIKSQKKLNKEIIIIGSSTGGPAALQTIVTKFPKDISIPILLIQHMPPGFTRPLANRLNDLCCLTVKEAEDQEILEAGTIYIAPAGTQTTLKKNHLGQYVVKLDKQTYVNTLYKPSIDVTLLSVSGVAKEKVLTVILTGMGDDGLRGCTDIKKHGGTVIAESEETCVVYGMPKVVFEAGLVDKKLPLPYIFDEIMANI